MSKQLQKNLLGCLLLIAFIFQVNYIQANDPPSINFNFPQNGYTFYLGEVVPFSFNASDSDGMVSKVELRDELTGMVVQELTNAPWETTVFLNNPGFFFYYAVAYDNDGATTSTSVITIEVLNTPIITMTSPNHNDLFLDNETITFTFNIDSPSEPVDHLNLYDGNLNLVGSSTTAPFDITIGPLSVGTYSFFASTTTAQGGYGQSNSIIITVEEASVPNNSPSISFNYPQNGFTFYTGDVIPFGFNASDSDGTIAKVELWDQTTNQLVQEITNAPWETVLFANQDGVFDYYAIAYDNEGATTSSAIVTIQVLPIPIITILSPNHNDSFLDDQEITFTFGIDSPFEQVDHINLYDTNSNLIGTSTTMPFDITIGPLSPGTYTYFASTTTAQGGYGQSNTIIIIVEEATVTNEAPTVSFVYPQTGYVFFTGEFIPFEFSATDADGSISKIELREAISGVLIEELTSAPWQTTVFAAYEGIHEYYAVAYDNEGATGTSATVTLDVFDTPEVSITSPNNNSTFLDNETINFTFDYNSTSTLFQLDLLDQNNNVVGTSTSTPFGIQLDALLEGNYSFYAILFNEHGGQGFSTSIDIVVEAYVNQAPTVNLINPTDGETFNINETIGITADASDVDGVVTAVNFYVNNELVHTSNTEPFNYVWIPATEDTYSLMVIATDDNELQTASEVVEVMILETTSTAELLDENIKLYPNPTNELVTLELSSSNFNAFSLIDINGRILRHQSINDQLVVSISLNQYPSGMYFIRLENEDEYKHIRVIKQ